MIVLDSDSQLQAAREKREEKGERKRGVLWRKGKERKGRCTSDPPLLRKKRNETKERARYNNKNYTTTKREIQIEKRNGYC